MDDTQLRLDGNAAAGMLREIFGHELTTARGKCASCGTIAPMGSRDLYMYPLSPGAVLRCEHCHDVLMVLVHRSGSYRVGLRGLTWMDVPTSAS
jgi:hypothetical protein